MLFQTTEFLLFFFALIAVLVFARTNKTRKIVFLVFSCFFYMWWNPIFILLILFTVSFDYWISLQIFKSDSTQKKRNWLLLSIIINLSVLAWFKYANFLQDNIISIASFFDKKPNWTTFNIILPVGISFYTFEAISYNIDVYRKDLEPPKSLLDFITFVTFFPKLVAGPIVRPAEFLPQMKEVPKINFNSTAIFLILNGLVKKIVIADNLGIFVDAIYQNAHNYPSILIVIAAVAFSFQIYCDFSGYTDIAIGIASILGYQFNTNFNKPYFAISPSDFWKRWHISLSSWLRDYLYKPLGGNKKGSFFTYRNLMITMLLGGLWHGASWNFMIWGFLHGFIQIIYRLFNIDLILEKNKLIKFISFVLFQIFVIFTWIVFRITNLTQLKFICKKVIFFDFNFSIASIGLGKVQFFSTIGIMITFLIVHIISYKIGGLHKYISARHYTIQIAFLFIAILLLQIFWPTHEAPFIYFQF
ncbi:MAG: hypothetical protein RI955_412 [Bacteroidota bacterium]